MKPKGFTLGEFLVAASLIFIVAGATVPLVREQVEQAKYEEARAAAQSIRQAAQAADAAAGSCPLGRLDDPAVLEALGMEISTLTGSYFLAGDYEIVRIDKEGTAVIHVQGSPIPPANPQMP